jgi:L-ascorbate metabolism protein UlaG (beta-lactamase superfamily)
MKITKIGHCCLVVEEQGVTLLTDPGEWSRGQNDVVNIDAVLITHEHADHLHLESLRNVLSNNPNARIITNSGVGAILAREDIAHEIVGEAEKTDVRGVLIEGFGTAHAIIYDSVPPIENTGYFIADKLFYPGDSLHSPGRRPEILALAVGGPWLKIGEAIQYAKDLNPRIAFPVHDAMFNDVGRTLHHRLPALYLEKTGIQFVPMTEGSVENF